MGVVETVLRLSDPYERHARLYPALLVFAPIGLTAICLHGANISLLAGAVSLLAGCGLLFWIASLVRDAGKKREQGLFDSWGGKPTTQLFRHRNHEIDVVTKKRYHAMLSKALGITFPSVEDESANPAAADQTYASATKWLIEKTRDPVRYALLLKENYSYGFHRNMLGARLLGPVIALAAIAWVLVELVIELGAQPVSLADKLFAIPLTHKIPLVGSGVLLLMWIFGVNAERARVAAFAYAERLLAACETVAVSPESGAANNSQHTSST